MCYIENIVVSSESIVTTVFGGAVTTLPLCDGRFPADRLESIEVSSELIVTKAANGVVMTQQLRDGLYIDVEVPLAMAA